MRLCYISAKFRLHPIGSPVKGSRQLYCRGVELKTIHYYLLPLHCGKRPLVGNGFIRFFSGALKFYGYIYCVSPTGGCDETITSGTGKPVPYEGAAKILH